MWSDGKGERMAYLRQLLAEGARPFRYRGRVRELLGLPVSSVAVEFSRMPLMAEFPYDTSWPPERLEFVDEIWGATRGQLDEPVSRTPSTTQSNSGEPLKDTERGSPVVSQTIAGEQIRMRKEVMTREQQDVVIPGTTLTSNERASTKHVEPPPEPTAHEGNTGESLSERPNQVDSFKAQNFSAFPKGDNRRLRGEADVASLSSRPDFLRARPSDNTVAHGQQLAAQSQRKGEAVNRRGGRDTAAPAARNPLKHAGSQSSLKDVPVTDPVQSGIFPPTQAQKHAAGAVRQRTAPLAEQAVSKTSETGAEEGSKLTRFPQLRRPDRTHREEDRSPTQSAEQRRNKNDASAVSSVVATQPPVVIIRNDSDRESIGAAPHAFWERRYLNHLRMRIRR